MKFEDVKDYLTNAGIEYHEDLLNAGAVAVYRVEEFGSFFMLNDKLELKNVEPDCGKAYAFSRHEDIPRASVDEFIDRVKGFNATVMLSFVSKSVKASQSSQPTHWFGLSASVFAPEGCLAVDDGELLSRAD